jgi:SAM-dependent methyltransferase
VTSWPYDVTAEFYDQDMGRNTDGRDVAWYVAEAGQAVAALGGSVVELGCGTGRVTLPLAAQGLRVIAMDRSVPMLRVLVRKAVAAGLRRHIQPVAADMSRAGLAPRFAAVLCPYSAFGYLIEVDDRTRMLAGVRDSLVPGGVFLLDMFIPDPALDRVPDGAEIHDYHWALPPGPWAPAVALARSKRLSRLRSGVNRIERCYRFLDGAGGLVREVWTQSDVRLYTSEALQAVLTEAGFTGQRVYGDFNDALSAAWPARVTAVAARLEEPRAPSPSACGKRPRPASAALLAQARCADRISRTARARHTDLSDAQRLRWSEIQTWDEFVAYYTP